MSADALMLTSPPERPAFPLNGVDAPAPPAPATFTLPRSTELASEYISKLALLPLILPAVIEPEPPAWAAKLPEVTAPLNTVTVPVMTGFSALIDTAPLVCPDVVMSPTTTPFSPIMVTSLRPDKQVAQC